MSVNTVEKLEVAIQALYEIYEEYAEMDGIVINYDPKVEGAMVTTIHYYHTKIKRMADIAKKAENKIGDISMSENTVKMPKYKCHKEVWALKIANIEYDRDRAKSENRETDGSATITPVEDGYAPFKVDPLYLQRHKPEVGGYFVKYAPDGYESYSPANVFEAGYTRIKE